MMDKSLRDEIKGHVLNCQRDHRTPNEATDVIISAILERLPKEYEFKDVGYDVRCMGYNQAIDDMRKAINGEI